jgi:hypothetical protein
LNQPETGAKEEPEPEPLGINQMNDPTHQENKSSHKEQLIKAKQV